MTRLELLRILVGQAHQNGFNFKKWYKDRLGLPWINPEAAFVVLDQQRRYYALLFSHEFASTFWKPGSKFYINMPTNTFQRTMPDGSTMTVTRKPFTKRSAGREVWRWHLRQMAVSEEPLRYMRRYLRVDEELEDEPAPVSAKPRREARPLPTELPAFLRRPYK